MGEMSNKTYQAKLQRLEAMAKAWSGNHHDEWPEMRDIARKLRMRHEDVMDMVEDSPNLILIVGEQTFGGIWTHQRTGDYKIEWIGDSS